MSSRSGMSKWRPALVGLAFLGAAGAAHAHHTVLRFNLEEMVVTSDRVFVGRCVGVEETRATLAGGSLPVTRYTFEVEQVVKGELPERFTFTQLGWPSGPAKGGLVTSEGRAVRPGLTLHGTAVYGAGDRLLLFLIPDYNDGRLTYPVGLDQGVFGISETGTGEETASNDLNNLGLFTAPYNGTRMTEGDARVVRPESEAPLSPDVPLSEEARALPEKRGALPLAPLLELVDKIHAAHGGAKGVLRPSKGGAS